MNEDKNVDIIPAEELMPKGNPVNEPVQNAVPVINTPKEEIKEELVNNNISNNVVDNTPLSNPTPQNTVLNNVPLNNPMPQNSVNPGMINPQEVNTVVNVRTFGKNTKLTEKERPGVNIFVVILSLLIIGGGIYFLIYGGKKQTLTCKMADEYMEGEIVIKFRNRSVDKISFKETVLLNSITEKAKDETEITDSEAGIDDDANQYIKKTIEDMINELKNTDYCKNLKGQSNEYAEITDCNQETVNGNIVVTASAKVKKTDIEKSVSDYREYFRDQGFQCDLED